METISVWPRDIEVLMIYRSKVFKSRLAKRFFILFICAALVPIMALTLISYYRVSRQLTDQAYDRLRQSAKSHALDIYERLIVIEHRLHTLQAIIANKGDLGPSLLSASMIDRNQELFTGLLFIRDGKDVFTWGEGVPIACREMVHRMNLAKETSTLKSLDEGKEWPTVAMVQNTSGFSAKNSFLIGTINPSFLWGVQTGTSLPPASEFYVFDGEGKNLFSSLGFALVMDHNFLQNRDAKNSGQLELTIQNKLYKAFYWTPFMKPHFHVPSWTVMVMEPRDHILQPLSSFRTIFLCTIVLSFLIVLFVTNRAIQASLNPIEALMEGARKVAQGLFSHHVIVKSKDEFQDLAITFNHMTDEIDTNFKALSARSNLDSAVLSVLDMDQIISTSLMHATSFISHSIATISILNKEDFHQGCLYFNGDNHRINLLKAESFRLTDEEYSLLQENKKWLRIDNGQNVLSYLDVLHLSDIHYFIVFPVWVQNRLFGFVSLGVNNNVSCRNRDLEQMRGFVDHLAIAFANSSLLQELKDLNEGTLYALARTVDAKSPWTAGHSVRVAKIASDIAKELGLSQVILDDLHRAALLHDIGKIGISLEILDKPGKLTDAEYDIIKNILL